MVFTLLLCGCDVTDTDTEVTAPETAAADLMTEVLKDPLIRNSSMSDPVTAAGEDDIRLVFAGEWDSIADKEYKVRLENLFYSFYPVILRRWGIGGEPHTITFTAEHDPEGVAYCSGSDIGLSIEYANEEPDDIGFFAHELTHAVQHYDTDLDWWTEGMASYGGFRYFHWAHEDTVSLIDQYGQGIAEWNYEPYGNCILFFAYLDYNYPTVRNADGTIRYGLIDSVNRAVRAGEIDSDSGQDDPSSSFNRVVRKVTGVDTIEEIRQTYVEECMSGSWVFSGFGDYQDNFITEDLITSYPSLRAADLSNVPRAERSDTVLVFEDNVIEGASVVRSSGYINDHEQDAFICDGDTGTKWCAESGDVTDYAYIADGVTHFIVLDLKGDKTFNAYTVYNAGTLEDADYNTVSWELLASDDGITFTPVDCQEGNGEDIASFVTGETHARYVMLKVFTPDSGVGTVRIYELQAGMV